MKNTNLADAKTNNAVLKKLRAVRPMSFRTALKRCAQHGFACDAAAVTDVMRFAMDAKFATKGKGWKNPNEVKCHAADPQNCRFHKTGKYAGQKDKDLFSVKKNGVYTAEDIQGFLKEQMEAAGFKVESLEAKLNAEKGCFEVSFKPGEGSDAEAMTGMIDDFVFDADGISLGLGEDNSGWEKGKDGVWKTAFETPESVDAMGGEGESGAETAMKEDDLGEPKIDPATGLKIPSHKIVSGTKTLKDFFGDGDKGDGEKKAKLTKEQKEKLEEIEGQITVADNQLSGFEQIGFKADAADWTKKLNTMGEDLVMYLSDEAGGDHDKDKVHNTFVNEAVNNEYTEKICWLEDHLDALASVKAVYDGAKNGLDGLSSKDKDNALKKMEDAANKYQELATKVVDDMYALQNALAATCEVTADKFDLGELAKADWEHIGSMEWPELTDMMFGNNEGNGEGDGGDAERSPGDGDFTETDEANSMKEELVKEFNMVFPDAGEYMVKSVTASEDGSTMKVQVDYPDVGDDEKEEGIEIDYEDVDVYESMCGVMAGYGYGCEATDKKGNHYTYTFEKDEDLLKFGEGENGGSAGGGASGGSGGGASSSAEGGADSAKKERKPLVCPMDPKGETKDLNIYVDEAKQLLDKAEKEGVDVNASELNGQHFGMPLKDWVSKNLKSMEVCHSALYSDDEIADFLKVGLTSMYKTAASNASSSMKIVEDELAKVKKSKAEQAQASSAASQGNGGLIPIQDSLSAIASMKDGKAYVLKDGSIGVIGGWLMVKTKAENKPHGMTVKTVSEDDEKDEWSLNSITYDMHKTKGHIVYTPDVTDKVNAVYNACLANGLDANKVLLELNFEWDGAYSPSKGVPHTVKLSEAKTFFDIAKNANPFVCCDKGGFMMFSSAGTSARIGYDLTSPHIKTGFKYVHGDYLHSKDVDYVVDMNGKIIEQSKEANTGFAINGNSHVKNKFLPGMSNGLDNGNGGNAQNAATGAATGAAASMGKKDKANVAKMLKGVAKSCDKGNAFKNKMLDLGNGDVAVTNNKVFLQMPKDMASETGLQTLDSSNSTTSMTGIKTFKDGIINAPAIGYIPYQKKVSDKLAKIYKSCLDKKIAPGDVTVAIDVQHYNGGNSGEKIIVKLPQAHQFFSAVDAFNPSVVSMNKGVLHFTDPNGKVFGACSLGYGANGNYYLKGYSETHSEPSMVVDMNGKVMEANGAAKGSYGLRGGESLLGGGAGGSEAASATPAQSTASTTPASSAAPSPTTPSVSVPKSESELKNFLQKQLNESFHGKDTVYNVETNGLEGNKKKVILHVGLYSDPSAYHFVGDEMKKLGYMFEKTESKHGSPGAFMTFSKPVSVTAASLAPSSSASTAPSSPAPASTPASTTASTGGEGNVGSYAYAEKKIAGIKDPKMKSLWEKVLAKAKGGGSTSGAGK